ncbi:MAG TPA: hypothetical protein VMP86_04035 [Candidatus Binatia bacterium]|nr:hypothetical protein [Candidatus Binatia bacterium]
MNRTPILLVALLALFVAACSSPQAAPTEEPTATVGATSEPTAEATDATDAPDTHDDGTSLEDLIPDELNGMARTDVPGMESFIGPMLEQQGVDGEAVEYVLATYGTGDAAITITAFRIPGMDDASLEALARLMSGAQSEGGSAEPVTVGGKSVLRMTVDEADGAAYLYFANGAVFTVVGESEDLAEQLLSELP